MFCFFSFSVRVVRVVCMSIRESLSSDLAWWKSHGTEMSNRARPVVAA